MKDENAESIDMKPLLSGAKTEDEGLFMEQHTYWNTSKMP
jgi:benzoate/toluate 1,2-dioxygenase subunit alpha